MFSFQHARSTHQEFSESAFGDVVHNWNFPTPHDGSQCHRNVVWCAMVTRVCSVVGHICEWTNAETVCVGRRMVDRSEEPFSRCCGGMVMRCSIMLSLRRRIMCAISKFNRGTSTNSCVVLAVGDFAEDLDRVVMFHLIIRVQLTWKIQLKFVIGLKVSIRYIFRSSVSSQFCGMSTQSWCVVARFPICALDGCGSVGDFAADIGRVLLCQFMVMIFVMDEADMNDYLEACCMIYRKLKLSNAWSGRVLSDSVGYA